MDETPLTSPGFVGKRRRASGALPPGQYLTQDFPVLSAGPTPSVSPDAWEFSVVTETGATRAWNWSQFRALPSEEIHT
ncbi:MAG TPA: hypothetical protein VHS56_11935, partial [Candidatus Cybelea sp.]|nr:hypothetical protein [Candidatus Cybelea sp.]